MTSKCRARWHGVGFAYLVRRPNLEPNLARLVPPHWQSSGSASLTVSALRAVMRKSSYGGAFFFREWKRAPAWPRAPFSDLTGLARCVLGGRCSPLRSPTILTVSIGGRSHRIKFGICALDGTIGGGRGSILFTQSPSAGKAPLLSVGNLPCVPIVPCIEARRFSFSRAEGIWGFLIKVVRDGSPLVSQPVSDGQASRSEALSIAKRRINVCLSL
jgi:hypothetical protein